MNKTFRKYFVPHAGNNYHPHILHAKRAWFYGALGVLIKGLVITSVALLPAEAFVMPNIIAVEESKMVMLTNSFRMKSGLPKLVENPKLSASAVFKAEDMAEKQYFAHENPEGKTLTYYLKKADYNYRSAGENLAVGYFDATEVVNAWKASPTHKANLLDKDFTEIGIGSKDGVYENAPTLYVAQHFGKPADVDQLVSTKPAVLSEKIAVTEDALLSQTATGYSQSDTADVVGSAYAPIKIHELPAIKNTTVNGVNGSEYSIIHKYFIADRVLGDTMPFFGYSKMIYITLIIFFTLALLLNIFVELKVRHNHVFIRTLSLIGVLAGLWLI